MASPSPARSPREEQEQEGGKAPAAGGGRPSPAAGRGGTGALAAAALLASFNSQGMIVLMPWTFAVLGFATGPVVLAACGAVAVYALHDMNRAAAATGAPTLGALGAQLGGPRFGALLVALQVLNQLLWMPFTLSMAAKGLQYLVGAAPGTPGACNVYYTLAVTGAAVGVSQFVREYSESFGRTAVLNVLILLVKCVLILYSIGVHRNEFPGNAAAVVGTGAAARASGIYAWYNVCSAFGNCISGYAYAILDVEVGAQMADPERLNAACRRSAVVVSALYVAVGVPGAVWWGVDASEPITLQLPRDAAGLAANVCVVWTFLYGYTMSTILVGGLVRTWLATGAAGAFAAGAAGRASRGAWFLITLLPNCWSLVLVSVVPVTQALVGLVTGLAGTLIFWSLSAATGLFWRRRRRPTPGDDAEGACGKAFLPEPPATSLGGLLPRCELRAAVEVPLWGVVALGVAATGAVLAAAGYFAGQVDFRGR